MSNGYTNGAARPCVTLATSTTQELGQDHQLATLVRTFEQLAARCPPEVSVRQQVLSSRRGDYLYVEIRTSFKVPIGG